MSLLLPVTSALSRSAAAPACDGRFIEHTLAHTAQTSALPVRFFESNGSGVAINDLNNDGLLDIVLGNLNGVNRVLWNQGGLTFRAVELDRRIRRTRAVQTVDVDADGWLDLLFTTQSAAPQWWRNNGDETFTLTPLPGVMRPAYTLAWADVDADGDLDIVTASYNAELAQLIGNGFLLSSGAGVYYYQNDDGYFRSTRLAKEALALALAVFDANSDGLLDLIVGNDFDLPDQSWSFVDGVWQPVDLLMTMTHSTMSFDVGDINNDGRFDLFAADMHPVGTSAEELHAWRFVLDDLVTAQQLPGDNQFNRNMLFLGGAQTNDALLRDVAAEFGIAATGWTWSSKFGDLDSDGYLDLYAVNGMASIELFKHLPKAELVEPNYAFRNQNGQQFIMMPQWGLGSTRGGRGMSMGDLDNDGDLDIVVNTLNTPALLFENQLCGGDSLQVELRWPGSSNPFGIGARLVLQTSSGTYTRIMSAASGYLSGDPARVHFGFPSGSRLEQLVVHWTDGAVTTVNQFDAAQLVLISR